MSRPLRIAAIVLAVVVLAVAVALLVGWHTAAGAVGGAVVVAGAAQRVRRERRAGAVRHREEVREVAEVQPRIPGPTQVPDPDGSLEAARRLMEERLRRRRDGRPPGAA